MAVFNCTLTLLLAFSCLFAYLFLDSFGLGPLAGLHFHAEDVVVSPPSASAEIQDPRNRLTHAKILYSNELFGPESLGFDSAGRGPYASLSDGRVVQRSDDDTHWETVATTSPSWSKDLCGYPPPPAAPGPNLTLETVCGRPLGIRFHPITGDLVVADAYFGLFLVPRLAAQDTHCGTDDTRGGKRGACGGRVSDGEGVLEEGMELQKAGREEAEGDGREPQEHAHPQASVPTVDRGREGQGDWEGVVSESSAGQGPACIGQVGQEHPKECSVARDAPLFGQPRLLANAAEGARFKFTNDMDIDATDSHGVIYFTDTSTKYFRRNFLVAILEGGAHGRLLKHDLGSGATTVLVRKLAFPNGVALSADRSFLIFCETILMRCHRYFVKGPRAGSFETFVELPGFPDNVRLNPRGRFWIAVHARRHALTDFLMKSRFLRSLLVRLLPDTRLVYLLAIGRPHGLIVEVDETGKVTDVLEDASGQVVGAVSEVEEHGGRLWMGSVIMPHIAVLERK